MLLLSCVFGADFSPYQKRIISLYSDNDAYFPLTDHDRYYSAGHSLYYTSKEYNYSFINRIGIVAREVEDPFSRFYIGIGQEMYTPDDRFSGAPPSDDELYAGFLYVNAGVQNRTGNIMEQVSLSIGVVGPASLVAETQDFIHSLTHNRHYNGWNTQIKNEPVVNLCYKLMYRLLLLSYVDILPYGVFALGNAHTHLEFGAKFRVGYGLDGDFGVQKAQADSIGSVSINNNFRIYLQLGFFERLVARNIFLEGNTIGGIKSNLSLNNAIYELEIGANVAWRAFSAGFVYSYRQKEFTTQLANHAYGSFRIDVGF